MNNKEKIALYTSLFRGRDDVYARRWDKNNHSGWSPAYSFDWNEFNAHRANGGSMKDFENKTLIPLSDEIFKKHLLGNETIGIYPILPDDTSYFIAADFDKSSWKEDVKKFVNTCSEYDLNTYTEISRSGNGAHVWLFFQTKYPCWKSRKIFLELLNKAFPFQQTSSFDRLFPNQDELTKGGFGNLVALPLQGKSIKNNCSSFYEIETGEVYKDQWDYIRSIQRKTVSELDSTYNQLFGKNTDPQTREKTNKLVIRIDGNIILNRCQLSTPIISFIKDELNIFNKEYGIKKRMGKSVFGTERYFHLIDDQGEQIILPRGFLHKITDFLDDNNIDYEIKQNEQEYERINFKSHIKLRREQKKLIEDAIGHTHGVIIAPPGSGKTIVALEMITRLQLPTLILVHRNQLLSQWIERAEQFLGIPKAKIGVISGTKKKVQDITIATIQSLLRYKKLDEVKNQFGVIVIDECHHIPAKSYRDLIAQLSSKYCYGLTATHERKYGHEFLTELCIGPIVAEMSIEKKDRDQEFDIDIKKSKLELPFRYKTDHYEVLARTICYDSARNNLVVKNILKHIKKKRRVLVLTERKDHIEVLTLHLRKETEVITLTGDDSVRQRKLKLAQITSGNFNVLLATGQLIGEGIDIDSFDVLVLAFPIAFEGRLKQYIGRLRGSGMKYVVDIHDGKVEFLDRQFKKRKKFYDKLIS